MSRYLLVTDIINRAAVECGLLPSADPVSDTNDIYVQMVGLLNSSGQELCELSDWPVLIQNYSITTKSTDSGSYDLPDDFNYMIDQTGWDRTNRLPVGGPVSAQGWTWLEGRNLVNKTIYASFRLLDGKIDIFPSPPPNDMTLTFEYVSRNWLTENNSTIPTLSTITSGSNRCILDPLLSIKFLKLKFLQAKGFDYSSAAMEFDTLLGGRIGKSTGAEILHAGGGNRGLRYITPYGNTPDTGFGS
tara:strand:+ start:1865 stop:2599 length:735 start_codon:yes stop_codon:yes gene_type:complete